MTGYRLLEPTYPDKAGVCDTKDQALYLANSFLHSDDNREYEAYQAHLVNQIPYYSFLLRSIENPKIFPAGGWPIITRQADGLTGFVNYQENDWLFPDQKARNIAIIEAFKPFPLL